MKVHPSDRQVLVFRGGALTLAPVPLWELGNKTLIWPKQGILGAQPPADPVTGRVSESVRPAEVEVKQINTQQPRNLLVRMPDDTMQIQHVVVVDHLEVV